MVGYSKGYAWEVHTLGDPAGQGSRVLEVVMTNTTLAHIIL